MIKRVRRACLNCRNSKVACDQQRPCTRCVKQDIGSSCYDLPRKKREKKPKQSLLSLNSPTSITINTNNISPTPIKSNQLQYQSYQHNHMCQTSTNSNNNKNTPVVGNKINDYTLSLSSSTSPSTSLNNYKSIIPPSLSISSSPSSPSTPQLEMSSPITSLSPSIQNLRLSNNVFQQDITTDQSLNTTTRNIYIPTNQIKNYASSITYNNNSGSQIDYSNIYSQLPPPLPQQPLDNITNQQHPPHQQYFYSNKSSSLSNNTVYVQQQQQQQQQQQANGQTPTDGSFITINKQPAFKRSYQSTNNTTSPLLSNSNINGVPAKKLNCSTTIAIPTANSTPSTPSSPSLHQFNNNNINKNNLIPSTVNESSDPLLNNTTYYYPTSSLGVPYTYSNFNNNNSKPTNTPIIEVQKGNYLSTPIPVIFDNSSCHYPVQQQQQQHSLSQDYQVVPSNHNSYTFIASTNWIHPSNATANTSNSYYNTGTINMNSITTAPASTNGATGSSCSSPTPLSQALISSSPITSSSIISAPSSSSSPSSTVQYRSSPTTKFTYSPSTDHIIPHFPTNSINSNIIRSNSFDTTFQYNNINQICKNNNPNSANTTVYTTTAPNSNNSSISDNTYYLQTTPTTTIINSYHPTTTTTIPTTNTAIQQQQHQQQQPHLSYHHQQVQNFIN